MTKRYKAADLRSVGHSQDEAFHMAFTIIDGHKIAVGQHIAVTLAAKDLVFLLSSLAGYYPDLISALAVTIGEATAAFGPPPSDGMRYDRYDQQRSRMYRDTVGSAFGPQGATT